MNNPFQSYNRGYTARERRIRRDLGMLLAITGIICVWLAVRVTRTDKELEETESINTVLQIQNVKLTNRADSLYSEFFNASTVNGRYELSLEHLKEVNPKAAKEFENFYNHETE
jgi:hypothetical protein